MVMPGGSLVITQLTIFMHQSQAYPPEHLVLLALLVVMRQEHRLEK
jgi:hypothetical protein